MRTEIQIVLTRNTFGSDTDLKIKNNLTPSISLAFQGVLIVGYGSGHIRLFSLADGHIMCEVNTKRFEIDMSKPDSKNPNSLKIKSK